MFRLVSLILIITFIGSAQEKYLFEINNLKIPIDNKGNIADVKLGNFSGGRYGEGPVLFSAGFIITGKQNGVSWGSGVASSSLIDNYQPGNVGVNPLDERNHLYIIKTSDSIFGSSWQMYRDAVALGASFYDGNKDGVYNPVDLNNNGKWDINEDAPDILGDVTAWCVYNDGNPRPLRLGFPPMGIEVHQTAFAYSLNTRGMRDILFVRYRLINRGTVDTLLDNVYFGLWSDPDVGEYDDNLVGCDTLLNAGYCYRDRADTLFGSNPPALLVSFVQGPTSYLPGVTFIDNNNDNIYNEGIDTPIDTAYNYKGVLGLQTYPGAANLPMTSFNTLYDLFFPPPEDPNYIVNYIRGKIVDPCTFTTGEVTGGVDCAKVNPLYWYSGDPVLRKGWLNRFNTDQRMTVNSGPFRLKRNEPLDIIAAYIVGRDNSPLSSITTAKQNAVYAKMECTLNFPGLEPNDISDAAPVYDYYLYHNYPNPFNSSTTIRFSLKNPSDIRLVVYDLLGREVAVLASGRYDKGIHEVNFDAANLSSGVYFYRLKAASKDGNNIMNLARKIILLK